MVHETSGRALCPVTIALQCIVIQYEILFTVHPAPHDHTPSDNSAHSCLDYVSYFSGVRLKTFYYSRYSKLIVAFSTVQSAVSNITCYIIVWLTFPNYIPDD